MQQHHKSRAAAKRTTATTQPRPAKLTQQRKPTFSTTTRRPTRPTTSTPSTPSPSISTPPLQSINTAGTAFSATISINTAPPPVATIRKRSFSASSVSSVSTSPDNSPAAAATNAGLHAQSAIPQLDLSDTASPQLATTTPPHPSQHIPKEHPAPPNPETTPQQQQQTSPPQRSADVSSAQKPKPKVDLSPFVDLVSSICAKIVEKQPEISKDVQFIQNDFMKDLQDPKLLTDNLFFFQILPNFQTYDLLQNFNQLRKNPAIRKLPAQALQYYHPTIDFEHIQAHVGGVASVYELEPLLAVFQKYPITALNFDENSKLFLSQSDEITPRYPKIIPALQKLRAAFLPGNHPELYEDLFSVAVKGGNFVDMANTIHKHYLSYSSPQRSESPTASTTMSDDNSQPQSQQDEKQPPQPIRAINIPENLTKELTSPVTSISYSLDLIANMKSFHKVSLNPEQISQHFQHSLDALSETLDATDSLSKFRGKPPPNLSHAKELDPGTDGTWPKQWAKVENRIPALDTLLSPTDSQPFPTVFAENNDQHELVINNSNIPLTSTKNGLKFAVTQILGDRESQQDRFVIAPELLGGDLSLFCVLDGAGSEVISQWTSENMVPVMQKMDDFKILSKLSPTQKSDSTLVNGILSTLIPKLYSQLDQEVLLWGHLIAQSKLTQPGQTIQGEHNLSYAASTCVVALYHHPSKSLQISHVGDSGAAMGVDAGHVLPAATTTPTTTPIAPEGESGEQSKPAELPVPALDSYMLIREHKPDQPEEKLRADANNGVVRFLGKDRPYLYGPTGGLNMSRGFGGYALKSRGLIVNPDILNLSVASDADDQTDLINSMNKLDMIDESSPPLAPHSTETMGDVDPLPTIDGLQLQPSGHFSTSQLRAKYLTTEHDQNQQTLQALTDISMANHFPQIRNYNQPTPVKTLILGSDGLFDVLSPADMVNVVNTRLAHITNPDVKIPPIRANSAFFDPLHTGLKSRFSPHISHFNSPFYGSPSDALTSQALLKWHGSKFAADNITGLVVFF